MKTHRWKVLFAVVLSVCLLFGQARLAVWGTDEAMDMAAEAVDNSEMEPVDGETPETDALESNTEQAVENGQTTEGTVESQAAEEAVKAEPEPEQMLDGALESDMAFDMVSGAGSERLPGTEQVPVTLSATVSLEVDLASVGADSVVFRINQVSGPESVVTPGKLVTVSEPDAYRAVTAGSIEVHAPGTYVYTVSMDPSGIRDDGISYQATVLVHGDGTADITWDAEPKFLAVSTDRPTINGLARQRALDVYNQMTTDERVGQVFMAHLSSNKINGTNLINTYHPGGILLFKADVEKYSNNPSGLKSALSGYQDLMKTGLMVAVDEEGGRVTRVASVPGYRAAGAFPAPQDLKGSSYGASMQNLVNDGTEKSNLLLPLGFNMNFAPVGDVADKGFIFSRTWGGDGIDNATYVRQVVTTARANGLGTSIKHFPGYGATGSDTHNGFAINYLEKNDFYNNDLLPFYAGIQAGADSVMITHNIINAFDTENPASLSPAIYKLLREDLGFTGIAITDDLGMGAVVDLGQPEVKALVAGADMVCTPNIATAFAQVKTAYQNGALSEAQMKEKVVRILTWKYEHGLLNDWFEETAQSGSATVTVQSDSIDGSSGELVLTPSYDYGTDIKTNVSGTSFTVTANRPGTYVFTVSPSDAYFDTGSYSFEICFGNVNGVLTETSRGWRKGTASITEPTFVFLQNRIPEKDAAALARARQILQSMTVREMAGQVFLCGWGAEAETIVRDYQPAGFYFDTFSSEQKTRVEGYPAKQGLFEVSPDKTNGPNAPVLTGNARQVYETVKGGETVAAVSGRNLELLAGASAGAGMLYGDPSLRDIGYDGILLGEGGAVALLENGYDLIRTDSIDSDFDAVVKKMATDIDFYKRVEEAALRVLYLKAASGMVKDPEPIAREVECTNGHSRFIGSFQEGFDWVIRQKGGTIKLLDDLALSGPYALTEEYAATITGPVTGLSVKIDLNGYDLSLESGLTMFQVGTGMDLTVDDVRGESYRTDEYPVGSYDDVYRSSWNSESLIFICHLKGEAAQTFMNLNLDREGGTSQYPSGKVYLEKKGKFAVLDGGMLTLDDGYILDANGSAVLGMNGASFTMNGGGICNGSTKEDGGAVRFPGEGSVRIHGGLLAGNHAGRSGGAVYGKDVTVDGNAILAWNDAKTEGGAVCVKNGALVLSDDAVLVGNLSEGANGGFSIGNGSVWIGGSAVIADNTAVDGGACYIGNGSLTLTGTPHVEDNFANVHTDLDLATGVKCSFLRLEDGSVTDRLKAGASVILGCDDLGAEQERVLEFFSRPQAAADWDMAVLEGIKSPNADYVADYVPETANTVGGIRYVRWTGIPLTWSVYLDGNVHYPLYYVRYSTQNHMLDFTAISPELETYGFNPDNPDFDATWFAFVDTEGQAHVYKGTFERDYGNRLHMDTTVDLTGYRVIYLGKHAEPGDYNLATIRKNYSLRSISVEDTYAILYGDEDSSRFFYVPDGSSINLVFEERNWKWMEDGSGDYVIAWDGPLSAAVSDIHSPVRIRNGENEPVIYNMQYYAYINDLDMGQTGEASAGVLNVIDTRGKRLPTNDETLPFVNLKVDKGGTHEIMRVRRLHQMFTDRRYAYVNNPTLTRMDAMSGMTGFVLDAVWVSKPGTSPISTDPNDFTIYTKADFPGLASLTDVELTDQGAADGVISIVRGSTVRLVYEPIDREATLSADFYDWDVTDGYIYSDAPSAWNRTESKRIATSKQGSYGTVYVNTADQGINAADNYSSPSTSNRLQFGNTSLAINHAADKYTGLKADGSTITPLINGANRSPRTYQMCAYGLVTGLGGDKETGFYPVFNSTVNAPNLFNPNVSRTGETPYKDETLVFAQNGMTYVLSGVEGTVATNLTKLYNPRSAYGHLWTNSFWPMDSKPSFGGDGHDPKFGDSSKVAGRKFTKTNAYGNITSGNLSESDDTKDHNSFFGMTYSFDFTIPAGYVGPLEYAFVGDDDMWVFLDGQLVSDIGGVHLMVGEYTNLWDFLDVDNTRDSEHTLTVFYTERGASGSTCWMNVTVPEVRKISPDVPQEERTGSLEMRKRVTGKEGGSYSFAVSMEGASEYLVTHGDEVMHGTMENGRAFITLSDGDSVFFPDVPGGTAYTITESEYGCDTSFTDGLTTMSGRTYTGTVVAETDTVITCTNAFHGGHLPDTGVGSFLWLLRTGSGLTAVGGWALLGLRRKHRRRG